MRHKLRDRLNIKKTTHFAIAINTLQILAMAGVFFYVLLKDVALLSQEMELTLLGFCLLIVIWGGIMDIREAVMTRKISEQTDMIEEAYDQLEDLNGLLRCQRHDFMNHLQVVFSLMEMKEYDEAMQYIERVYGDIQRVSSVLKTSIPAVNALIAAKNTDCTEDGIAFTTEISSAWNDCPIPGWEMCRIFGNLIDNARDAISSFGISDHSYIRVALGETPNALTFSVANNGPKIPEKNLSSIFQLGFTTKSEGHGSGLSIVFEILESHGGRIEVQSSDQETVFSGTIPKPPRIKTEKS